MIQRPWGPVILKVFLFHQPVPNESAVHRERPTPHPPYGISLNMPVCNAILLIVSVEGWEGYSDAEKIL